MKGFGAEKNNGRSKSLEIPNPIGKIFNFSPIVDRPGNIDPLFPKVESFFRGMDIPSQTIFPIPAPIIEKLQGLKKTLALNRVV